MAETGGEDEMMVDEKINNPAESEPTKRGDSRQDIGGGTPLHENPETPIYNSPGPRDSLGIGPGTPLFEPEAVLPGEKIPPAGSRSLLPEIPEIQEITLEIDEAEENFAKEFEQSLLNEPEAGEVLKGRILRMDGEDVIIDLGMKSEGVLAKSELLDPQGALLAQVGEEVEVLMERRENSEGLMLLSRRKLDRRRVWNLAKTALADGTSLNGWIVKKCKGGFMVDLGGVESFLPASQLELHAVANPDEYLGKMFQFQVIKINRERKNIVVSRRSHLLAQRNAQRSVVMSSLQPGRIVRGVVKNLTHFGAFVDLGGVDGLLHVNDMSWSKITHPRQVVKVGDEIEAVVLSMDEAAGKVSLGLKQKSQNPWENLDAKYPVGSLVEAEVVSLMDFGAFLKLEEGVEGLLPLSELSWTKRPRHAKEILKAGDRVRVKVLSSKPSEKKLTLGLRQVEPEPFGLFCEDHRVGETVTGEVKTLTEFGAFVEVAEGVTGLLHISDISWDASIKHPKQVLNVGDKISVKLLEVHTDKRKMSLGLKQLTKDPWISAAKRFPVGTVVQAKVLRNTKFGVFVQIEPGIEGLIHASQMPKEKNEADFQPLPENEMVEAKVVKVNWEEHKIGLSIREALQDQEQAEIRKYLNPANKPGISLAELSGISREDLLKRVEPGNPGE